MSRPIDSPLTTNAKAMSTMSSFFPLLILGLALAAWFGFQAIQLNAERDAMRGLVANQDKQVEESKKLRDSLDAIARGTAQLSDAGNANARLVIEELKKRGVVVNPNPAPGSTGVIPAPNGTAAGTPK